MEGKTHMVIGASAGLSATLVTNEIVAMEAVMVAGSLLGSLLPDADHRDALIYHRIKAERNNLLFYALGTLLRLPLWPFKRLPHRGPVTHGPFVAGLLMPILATMVAVLASNVLVTMALAGVAIGYVMHLVGDGMTPHGLPGWPFCKKVHLLPRGWRPRTGSIVEHLLAVFLILGTVGLLYSCGDVCSPEKSAAAAIADQYVLDSHSLTAHAPTPAGVVYVSLGERRWHVKMDGCKVTRVDPMAKRLR